MKTYGTINSPARVGVIGEIVYGVFYHARQRHVAPYVPYKKSPYVTFCGRGTFAATREINNMCQVCLDAARNILGTIEYA